MHAVEAVLVAESRLGELGEVSPVAPLSGERWLAQRTLPNELVVLDGQLTPIWRVRLPAGRRGSAAVAEDLSLVALPQDGQVLLLDGTGRQLASFPASSSNKTSSGCSCAVFTNDDTYLWAILPARGTARPGTASQELWLIDVATGSVLDRRRLAVDVNHCGCRLLRHPDGRTIGLSLWAEAGALIGWAGTDRGRIGLRLAPWRDRVLANVHPAGAEYLTLPHRGEDEPDEPLARGGEDELLRHRLRDDRPVGVLAASAVHPEEWWECQAGYLTGELILASTIDSGQHVLVGTAPMRPLAEVVYPKPIATSWSFPSGQGTWLTVSGPGPGMQRWVLPLAPGAQLQLPLI